MAIDKKLQIFDDEGNPVDYDILASDVKFNDGKDLPTKLAEMEEEIGEGGYTPPQGGIPKTDLAPSVQQTLDDVANKVDKVPGKGLSTNDYTTEDKTKLGDLPTADQLSQQMGSKANSSDLQNYATKNELTSGLSGKQNTLTFDDAPTAGSNNPVKSGGIKTALDTKADAADVPTKTEMSDAIDDAFSDAQVAVVPAGSIGVIDGMGSDSTTDALSANMGKRFKAAILTLMGAMGNYCFPGGKPQLILDGSTSVTFSVSYSTSDLHVTYADGQGNTAPSTVDLLGRLEIQLGTNNNLYVINENSVHVFVGGNEVSNAYDPTTDKIVIPEVYGNVVIIAEAWTYVSRGLVMHLDGRNRGGTAGKWKSLVDYNSNPLYFKLENCDEQSDYVAGNGTNSKGTAFSNSALTTPVTLLDVSAFTGTIEAAYNGAELDAGGNLGILHNAYGSGNRICMMSWNSSDNGETKNKMMLSTSPVDDNLLTGVVTDKTNVTGGGYYSFVLNSYKRNGETIPGTNDRITQTTDSNSMLSIFWRKTTNERNFKLNLYALRVYSVQLTDAERAQNLAIDQKRFNLA